MKVLSGQVTHIFDVLADFCVTYNCAGQGQAQPQQLGGQDHLQRGIQRKTAGCQEPLSPGRDRDGGRAGCGLAGVQQRPEAAGRACQVSRRCGVKVQGSGVLS